MTAADRNTTTDALTADIRDACKHMYDEMLHWSEQGFTVLFMERDGDTLKLRPIA